MNCSIAKVRTTVSWLSIYKRETVGARVRVRGERTILLWIPLVGHLLPSITTSAPTHFLISWCYFDTGNYASYSWIMRSNCCCIANSTNSSFSSDWQFSMNRLHHQPFHIAKKSMARVLEIVWKIDKIHNVFITSDSSSKTILKLSYSPFVFSCCDNWLFVKHHFLPVKIYKSTSKLKHFLNEPFHTNQLIDPKWLQETTQSVKKPSKIASKMSPFLASSVMCEFSVLAHIWMLHIHNRTGRGFNPSPVLLPAWPSKQLLMPRSKTSSRCTIVRRSNSYPSSISS